ncbi:DNA cytosine methyltransferase [Thiothrix lacustris]|uniref:DNA cytosine methyltransferase n=1 Tax=Thiothrix lacustris TaxID=525917 RepID=UPI0027E42EDD|nr:DNA (cytosine-5-)-methyltransferase [Thiothrix lacustris]WMP15971.1 DNA (cytosine-5-)-methyltransferase [Thiothrix lacustris]
MKTLELFSGAGGLAKGLELAGFHHVKLVEFNKHACATLKANFGAEKVFAGDIRDFSYDGLQGVDIVAGGPPCQPFSLGGKHQADQDHRDMFPYAINAIRELQPKAFIFENVKGLLRPSFADYFEYIVLRLTYPDYKPKFGLDWQLHLQLLRKLKYETHQGLKYNMAYQLVNAADYGVPQSRERVFMVGIRADLDVEWVFPTPTHANPKKLDVLKNGHGLFPTALKPWQTVRDALGHLPDPRSSNHTIPDHIFRDGARVYPGHTGSDHDWPAKTLKAGGHGVPGGENMLRYRDGSLRYFTVHEAKLLQTFPADFHIEGAWGEAMRQIGNAVPVLLAQTFGQELHKTLRQSALAFDESPLACAATG